MRAEISLQLSKQKGNITMLDEYLKQHLALEDTE